MIGDIFLAADGELNLTQDFSEFSDEIKKISRILRTELYELVDTNDTSCHPLLNAAGDFWEEHEQTYPKSA